MKKIIYTILIIMVFPLAASSQVLEAGDIYKIWSFPVVYNFDQPVSWFFDLSGTTFTANEDLYIWIWSPSEPDAGNWNNSSDFAKLTYVSGMIWRFDLTPTLYFGKTPEEIKASAGFWLRLKDKTGTTESSVAQVPVTDFSSFATSGKNFQFYAPDPLYAHVSEKFYLDQPLSILFNANNFDCFADADSVHMHAGLNDWDLQQQYQAWLPEICAKTRLVNMGDGIYRMDLPTVGSYFNAPEGYVMTDMNFLFVKDNWACTTSPDFLAYAPDVPVPPEPVLSFFPMKVSVEDILVITRQYNLVGQHLKYSVTGGDVTITGDFAGNMDSQSAFINLIASFSGMDITKLSVTVSDQNDNTIFEGDIPLVKKD